MSAMKLSETRPMIATPCYGGMVYEGYLRGVASVVAEYAGCGLPINISTIINESLITRARNEIVKQFLVSECTHLFFIDADICFAPHDFFRLLQHDKDVVVASYPLKGQRWENLNGVTEVAGSEDVRRRITEHVVNFKFDSEENAINGKVEVKDGLIEVHEVGTGFMCIKRNVIEQMVNEIPNIGYLREPRFLFNEKDDGIRWAVFDTDITDTGRYLSEDYLFCERWKKLGGSIWLDPFIVLTHMGTHGFTGHKLVDIDDPLMTNNEISQQRFIGGK